jgi:uncharacterized protein
MIKRTLSKKLLDSARKYPVVFITGPRQSGKTTLAQVSFPKYQYVSLEDLDKRQFAIDDPRGFLATYQGNVIFDEIQRVPELLSYIQTEVDRDDTAGRFILTGSQQFLLMEKVGQTLAGRVALLYLLPFSLSELTGSAPADPFRFGETKKARKKPAYGLEQILYQGLYPRIYDKKLSAHQWIGDYYRTYVERDVRDVLKIGNLDAFQRFVRLCAGRCGQLLNLSSLANDCGITHPTARQWVSVLQSSLLVVLLSPHYANFSKRLIKSPKLYFLDSGLLCYLLRIRDSEELRTHALRGAIFESFIVSELYKAFSHIGEEAPLYFWRDQTGHEIDLIIDTGKKLIPGEIKSSQTLASDFFDGLRYWLSLKGNPQTTGILIYAGGERSKRDNFSVMPWYDCS